MTTSTQSKWLEALAKKLQELDDPDPEIITRDSYTWTLTNLKRTGKIPKVSFEPYGRDTPIKAEIMRSAGIFPSDEWKIRREEIRERHGLKSTRDAEDRELARKFNKLSNDYWSKVRNSLAIIQEAQKRFCKENLSVADPVRLIIEDLIPGFQDYNPKSPETEEIDRIKPYDEELSELA